MFKTSQEIRLNTTGTKLRNSGENVSGFGKYHKTPDMGKCGEKIYKIIEPNENPFQEMIFFDLWIEVLDKDRHDHYRFIFF